MPADGRTVVRLALRHLLVRRARAAVLLLGYAIGAAVMMVLLSIGEAMLVQSRDVTLVGGGDVTVLPDGIDFEGLRTGSLSGMFYGIDRARFLQRQMIGGPRLAPAVAAVSPAIEHKLLYLRRGDDLIPLRAGAEIPSAARAVGAGLDLVAGSWEDSGADSAFRAPSPEQLYHELDRFHAPPDDTTWAEWHYFNLAPGLDEHWYVTFLVGAGGRGQLLVTRHRPGAPPAAFESMVPAVRVRFDTTRADLELGPHLVVQREGAYRLTGAAAGPRGSVRFDLTVVPEPNAYFPPVELRRDEFVSGYVVPAVRATASGTICESGSCRRYQDVPAYHDHNWGVWRETSWEWGQARGAGTTALYGGVLTPDSVAVSSGAPFFLALVDGLGVRQVMRFSRVDYGGGRPVPNAPGVLAPERFAIRAAQGRDTVALRVRVLRAQATRTTLAGGRRHFLQMRGAFTLTGRLGGLAVADSGLGSFETFVADGR